MAFSKEPEAKSFSVKAPALESIPDAEYKIGGELGRRLAAVTEQWIIPAPYANPQMLEMFRTKDRKPIVRNFDGFIRPFPWIGEYAGKYLTHAVQTYKCTHDKKLLETLATFVAELVSLQEADGYMGPWPKEKRFTPGPWDTWGHYHIMVGLLLWYEQTHDQKALDCAIKIGDMLCNNFLNSGRRILDTGSPEMNMAPVHSMCLLYKITGEKRYLDLALEIEKEFTEAGDYVRAGLEGREFFQTPRPRWESLHSIMGIAELYYATGDEKYKKAFENLWWSMAKCDRHNNGGFSSMEAAHGDPYMPGAIETCCTVAWMALTVDMLRLSGDSRVADELELSMINSGIGMMSPSGRWVTYDTPMDGIRYPSLQCGDPGGPHLNCCSVNGPRAIAMTCEWAIMRNNEGLVVNYYGPCTMSSFLPDGTKVSLMQETDYPVGNRINLIVKPAKTSEFTLTLRMPAWSKNTSVSINGEKIEAVPGQYLKINRRWKSNDRVVIDMDFSPHFWVNKQAMQATHWDAKWTIFGPFENLNEKQIAELDKQVVASATEIPKSLTYTIEPNDNIPDGETKILTPKTETAVNGYLDMLKTVDQKDANHLAYIFAEYESPVEGKLRLAHNTSGYAALWVNGVIVPAVGNGENPQYGRNLLAEIPVVKGRNIIAFKLPKERFTDMFWVWNVKWHLNAGWENPYPNVMITSIYRGPVLLTYDPRYNTIGFDDLPVLEAKGLTPTLSSFDREPKPMVLCELKTSDGKIVRLCDFGNAGNTGTFYRSWLKVRFEGATSNEFTKENPLRSFRP